MAAIAAQDDCLPAALLPPLGDGLAMGTGGPDSLFAPAGAPGGGDSGRAFPIGYGVPGDDRPGGVGGGIGGGGGTPGGPGGPGGPSGPGGPGTTPSPPSASPAPEPTSWALMLIGFGVLGGAMRYHHVRANAA